jgi:hypothetical protein
VVLDPNSFGSTVKTGRDLAAEPRVDATAKESQRTKERATVARRRTPAFAPYAIGSCCVIASPIPRDRIAAPRNMA